MKFLMIYHRMKNVRRQTNPALKRAAAKARRPSSGALDLSGAKQEDCQYIVERYTILE